MAKKHVDMNDIAGILMLLNINNTRCFKKPVLILVLTNEQTNLPVSQITNILAKCGRKMELDKCDFFLKLLSVS